MVLPRWCPSRLSALIGAVLPMLACSGGSSPSTEIAASRIECGDLPGIDAYVGEYLEMAAFEGVVLIAQDDDLVYECAYGLADYRFDLPLATDARFRIASLSKQFTEVAIGRLVDAGEVSLDASLATYMPTFPNADRITIQELLEHTSGVPHTNTLGWMDMHEGMSLDEIVAGLATEPLDFPPGTNTAYSNGGYALLAAVIERVSGKPFRDFISREYAANGFPSVGHEEPYQVVPGMAHRYAPGPAYGKRVEARTYVVANRIGGGSLYAAARDVWRFFRDSYTGKLVSDSVTARLFPTPEDGDVRITGRSPGCLAQVYLDLEDGLTVVTLSSNSGWPGSFNADIVALYRGEDESAALAPFTLAALPFADEDASSFTGEFTSDRFGWNVRIERGDGDGLVFEQGDLRTAFVRTSTGSFHLPIYDWLCDYDGDRAGFTCRQRDLDNDIRFSFRRTR
jgi:CubicO group peptidase (beta-lactamase class C family)